MSHYYNSQRSRNMYDASLESFRLSRGKIDLFLSCQQCFYLDRKLGVGRPPGFPFSLNSAVDALLKKEFDVHRANGSSHPLMKEYGVDAVPFQDERMDEWRDSLRRGITAQVAGTNILVTGGVDDVWVRPDGELIIVDYKATSKTGEVNLDADWQDGYKRQMETYQWLFRQNGFKVSRTGYFVYCNGDSDKEAFDGKLEFKVRLLGYEGDDSWVEQTVRDAVDCLKGDQIPPASPECDFCNYREAVEKVS
ncbi:MAG: PD-(D/E)XK nuclease family protein [Candidatus Levybacteria bacterium]|nr:PD-(D/E)XK nuclease family protein [Candidatus Levybacteria bacterium]